MFNNQFLKKKKSDLFVIFADIHGLKTLSVASFRVINLTSLNAELKRDEE